MVFSGWYTDSVDVYRVEDVADGYITKQKREKSGTYACRIYRSQKSGPVFNSEAAKVVSQEVMAVELGTDIKPGDELIITRGGNLGETATSRYFAGDVMPYYEPVGGMFNGLGHIEVGLLQEEVIKA
jgi:hypothetical protein